MPQLTQSVLTQSVPRQEGCKRFQATAAGSEMNSVRPDGLPHQPRRGRDYNGCSMSAHAASNNEGDN